MAAKVESLPEHSITNGSEPNEMNNNQDGAATEGNGGEELRKSLGFIQAFAYVVGILLGTGVFVSPSLVARQTSNMGMALIAWLLAAIPCLLGALCLCELACMLRKTGGTYLFILEAYGQEVAYITIWAKVIVVMPAVTAILGITAGEHILSPFYDIFSNSGIWLVKTIAVLFCLASFGINCLSNSFVGKTQVVVTATQTLITMFIVCLGVLKISQDGMQNFNTMFQGSGNFDLGKFGIALYNGLWAYDGWACLSSITEELRNVERDLRLAVVTGISFVTVCFLLISLALMSALTHKEIAQSATVTSHFVVKVLGSKASFIIPVAVTLSCFGSSNAAYFMQARATLSAAREGQLPAIFSYIHRKKRTPVPATFLQLVITTIWVLSVGEKIESMITSMLFAVWLEYSLAIFAVVVLRLKRPMLSRPFKVWLANPIVTSIIALFLVVVPFVRRPIESSVCLAILLTGIPVHYVFVKKKEKLPNKLMMLMNRLEDVLQSKLNLVPCIYKETP
eukprot:Seg3587.2 transcript_id=Seg3587.2/GoldUCD/mRNA.D3Y31 product="Glycoprotein-associated_amino acid transporter b0,+AT1" protein_id=Seg3587.2/GoldUCD/D3Y31